MAGTKPTAYNPLDCFLRRQIDDRVNHCRRLVSARVAASENLFRKDLLSHYGCVNAIEFSPQGDLLVSGGDDRRVLVWKVEQAIQGVGKPFAMRAQHGSNIFCLGYDSQRSKIFSAGNDDRVIVHNLETGDPLNYFLHEKPVYGLSVHPSNDNVFSSACDDGRVLIFDTRDSSGTEPLCLAQYKTAFHSVMFNPTEPRTLATANASEGISLWDVRKALIPVLRYGNEQVAVQGCMNVRFNSAGTRLLALRRRLPPILYATDSPNYLCHFDQPGYYNNCTMKSCCFAGDDDEYVLSGSDDFNLYMWKIPSKEVKWVDSAHMILRGHRSIVNQVRYNRASCVLASSGVEKIIKIWSPFPLCNFFLGGLKRDSGKQEQQRQVFTHDEYIRLVLRSGQFMTHDYSHQSTKEDPRMMAFFDSLVQREIEGWGSEDTPPPANSNQRNSTETKNTPTPTTEQTQSSATDSEDSSASAHQLMRSLLGATARNGSRAGVGGGVTPERSIDSPNRITRLIGNRREKLMRLAALEAGLEVVNSNNDASVDNIDNPNETQSRRRESVNEIGGEKSKSKKFRSKVHKRKQNSSVLSSKRLSTRRKCVVFNLKLPSDSDSDMETPRESMKNRSSDSDDELLIVDVTQPSTSSGMTSRRSRYTATLLPIVDSDVGNEDASSKSSGESDIENCNNRLSRRKRLRTNSIENTKNKIFNSNSSNNNNNRHSRRNKRRNSKIALNREKQKNYEKEITTPSKESSKKKNSEPTPDSGVASGISTMEKAGSSNNAGANESSDHESKIKNLEMFKKKIDAARRGYRKRSTPSRKESNQCASDSSD